MFNYARLSEAGKRIMRILGIETSCDETAIAIVESGKKTELVKLESDLVLSQIQTHKKFGGVVPEVAAREHLRAIFPMLESEVSRDGKGIDAIAVTAGPGLAPALRVGVEVAKTLSWLWGVPLIPICHLEAHLYANWIQNGDSEPNIPKMPALALLVSGGHTELIYMKSHGKFDRIGETLDDAAGEAFDKVAKMLGLPYPGGPEISKLAKNGNAQAYDFPRGLLDRPNLDFSFSGLKTSVLYTLRDLSSSGRLENAPNNTLNKNGIEADIAASFQEAVVDVLVRKTIRAAKKLRPKSIILAGGVAANESLRSRLIETAGEKLGLVVHVPQIKYAMDNAAMVAAAGAFRAQSKKNFVDPAKLVADPNLDIV